jgi:hypothetical protein
MDGIGGSHYPSIYSIGQWFAPLANGTIYGWCGTGPLHLSGEAELVRSFISYIHLASLIGYIDLACSLSDGNRIGPSESVKLGAISNRCKISLFLTVE